MILNILANINYNNIILFDRLINLKMDKFKKLTARDLPIWIWSILILT